MRGRENGLASTDRAADRRQCCLKIADSDQLSPASRMAMSPILRAFEFTLPHASACRLGFSFGVRIAAVAENVVDRVALAHKHFADIGNISGGADGEGAAVTIQAVWYASNAAFGNQL